MVLCDRRNLVFVFLIWMKINPNIVGLSLSFMSIGDGVLIL